MGRSEQQDSALRAKWHLRTFGELKQRCQELDADSHWVESILPSRSLCLLAGESGLGKSPLAYQLAVCVSSGKPFLGLAVKQTTVVCLDYENGLGQVKTLLHQLAQHLGLEDVPANLRVWSANDPPPQWGKEDFDVWRMIEETSPGLVIIDSLGSCLPEVEETNKAANLSLQRFREITSKCLKAGTSVLLLHHLRKPSEQNGSGVGSLEDESIRRWFTQVRGARALINGTDVRIGVDEPGISTTRKRDGQSEVALVVRGFGRISGDIPTLYLSRAVDEEGEPRGYTRLRGAGLLLNQEHEAAFNKLGPRFRFKDAQQALGKGAEATTGFLKKCLNADIARRAEGKAYEKQPSAE